jgi:hypothetical protein
MANQPDSRAVRKALDQARAERKHITRNALLPIDTAHIVGSCPNCGTFGATVLGFPDPPYAGRFRNARELERFLGTLSKDLGTRPPPLHAPTDTPDGQRCKCGAPADPRTFAGLRFIHAMPGTGAEIIAEGVVGGGSLLIAASGAPLGGEAVTWTLYRAPHDGLEAEIGEGFSDRVIEQAFGRALTLAQTWLRALDSAKGGQRVIEAIEPGYWIFAAPGDAGEATKDDAPKTNGDASKDRVATVARGDDALTNKLREVIGAEPERAAYGLAELGMHAPLPMGPAWPQWAHEHAQAIASGALRAGVVVDHGVVRKLLTTQLERLGLAWKPEQDGRLLVVQAGENAEVRWPLDVLVVGLGSAHLGWTFAETAAAAIGEAAERVRGIVEFLTAVRAARPEIKFTVQGAEAIPERKDGTKGRPINLSVVPFRLQPGTPDFDREVRFACDELPKDVDPTTLCPCGAKGFVAARLFPWTVVERFREATGGKAPAIIEKWEDRGAALLATISCDRHVRIPSSDEIEQAGLGGGELETRLKSDLKHSMFAVAPEIHEDSNKRRALLVYGPLVASVVMNDHLISALHSACKLPDGTLPMRAKQVEAQVTTPNVLCMYEEGFDDDQLDRVLEIGASLDGLPPDVATPFSLTWDVRLDVPPVGRFVDLYPPQQGQGGPPGGAPGGPPQGPSGRPAPGRPAGRRN